MVSLVSHMTWDELDSKAKNTGVALIPAGSTERHGRHLPMETDSATAVEVARRVGENTDAVVFPCLDYGVMEHPAFKGAFLSERTYTSVVKEVCLGVEKLGFRKILFISGHGPNNACILNALKELFLEKPKERLLGLAHCMTLINQLMPDLVGERQVGHSHFRETSIMLAIDEAHVYPDQAVGVEAISGKFAGNLESVGVHLVGLDKGRIHLCHESEQLKAQGCYGQVQSASKAEGENILEVLADFLSRMVVELEKIELPLT